MLNIGNLTSYVPPMPIMPVAPNFAFCHSAYGSELDRQQGLYAGGILPYGTLPVEYLVVHSEIHEHSLYELPFAISFGGIAVTVDIAGPVLLDKMTLVPNHIRGMVAYLANYCVGRRRMGGFVTRRIQGLVDYVTDPLVDIDIPEYPASTAFLTVTMSSPQHAHSFPGDYDPVMARVLCQAESKALHTVSPQFHLEIADRAVRYSVQAACMSRLGNVAWWENTALGRNRTNHLSKPDSYRLTNGTVSRNSTA